MTKTYDNNIPPYNPYSSEEIERSEHHIQGVSFDTKHLMELQNREKHNDWQTLLKNNNQYQLKDIRGCYDDDGNSMLGSFINSDKGINKKLLNKTIEEHPLCFSYPNQHDETPVEDIYENLAIGNKVESSLNVLREIDKIAQKDPDKLNLASIPDKNWNNVYKNLNEIDKNDEDIDLKEVKGVFDRLDKIRFNQVSKNFGKIIDNLEYSKEEKKELKQLTKDFLSDLSEYKADPTAKEGVTFPGVLKGLGGILKFIFVTAPLATTAAFIYPLASFADYATRSKKSFGRKNVIFEPLNFLPKFLSDFILNDLKGTGKLLGGMLVQTKGQLDNIQDSRKRESTFNEIMNRTGQTAYGNFLFGEEKKTPSIFPTMYEKQQLYDMERESSVGVNVLNG